jgi:GNAT superfamily N-acetyltransferase
MTIRPIAHHDHAQWLKLWAAYNAFYGRRGATALDPCIIETTWARFFDPSEPVHTLVAEREGNLRGLAHFLFHRTTIRIEPTCYLQDLYSAEESRGAGIGRRLIEAVYEYARAAGSARVYWQTHETNDTALRLYDQVAERSGFILYRKLL